VVLDTLISMARSKKGGNPSKCCGTCETHALKGEPSEDLGAEDFKLDVQAHVVTRHAACQGREWPTRKRIALPPPFLKRLKAGWNPNYAPEQTSSDCVNICGLRFDMLNVSGGIERASNTLVA
jgi:hypothetical protein